jgi:hypothetical protein
MPNIKNEVKEYVTNVITHSAKTGCTLMYNTATTMSNMSMDMFVYTLVGVVCIDPTSVISLFEETLMLIGP